MTRKKSMEAALPAILEAIRRSNTRKKFSMRVACSPPGKLFARASTTRNRRKPKPTTDSRRICPPLGLAAQLKIRRNQLRIQRQVLGKPSNIMYTNNGSRDSIHSLATAPIGILDHHVRGGVSSTGSRRALTALSLFSGGGGMDLGIRSAGFNVVAQIENDPHCCATLQCAAQREKSQTRIIEMDIRALDSWRLADELNLIPRGLDLLFGGPPCQAFSAAGKKLGLADERGPLLFEIVRFAETLKPKVILLEQVPALLSAKGPNARKGEVFEMFVTDLKRIGYAAKWKVLLAADYGVAQLRKRLFVVAARGQNGFAFPQRSHAPQEECNGFSALIPYSTVGIAIQGLGEPTPKGAFPEGDSSHVDVTRTRDRERIAQVPEGCCLASQTHLSTDLRRGLTSKDTTKMLRTHRERPANTLRCGEIFFHPTENRYLTPRECMRIHGYPDDYELKGPIRPRTGSVPNLDQHRQVANSVPPPLARVLGAQIVKHLNESNSRQAKFDLAPSVSRSTAKRLLSNKN
jgi:DNA (cytosine-5)-methyltransferase 1